MRTHGRKRRRRCVERPTAKRTSTHVRPIFCGKKMKEGIDLGVGGHKGGCCLGMLLLNFGHMGTKGPSKLGFLSLWPFGGAYIALQSTQPSVPHPKTLSPSSCPNAPKTCWGLVPFHGSDVNLMSSPTTCVCL